MNFQPRRMLAATLIAALAATAASASAMEVKVALNYPASDPSSVAAEGFAERIKELSGGAMEVQLFPAGQAGDNKSQLQALQLGAFEINIQGLTQYPAYDGLNLPYFWKSNEHFLEVINGELFEPTREKMAAERGIRMVGIANRGYRNVLSRTKPLQSMDDFKGLKIRAPMAPPFVKAFEALGARPTPVEWSETYNAMLLGTVDAMENANGLIYSTKFYEVGKHLTLTRHLVAPSFFMVSEKWYKSLTDEQRGWIDTALEEAIAKAQEIYDAEDAEFLDKLKAEGVTIHEPDLGPFAEASAGAIREIGTEAWGEELFNKVSATTAQY